MITCVSLPHQLVTPTNGRTPLSPATPLHVRQSTMEVIGAKEDPTIEERSRGVYQRGRTIRRLAGLKAKGIAWSAKLLMHSCHSE